MIPMHRLRKQYYNTTSNDEERPLTIISLINVGPHIKTKDGLLLRTVIFFFVDHLTAHIILIVMKIIFLILFIGVAATTELARYMPRGWRPSGRHFNPGHSQPHAYYRPVGPPNVITYPPAAFPPSDSTIPTTTASTSSTIPSTTTPTTSTITVTTTERNIEPTTQPNLSDESFDTNPALAIANSFAFNRPVYVYNTFPFLPGHVLVK
ncbi:uncharacterized protein LOC124424544 isoform X1 [Vespa crabro]|uniref:uncharacterized protein LOC124424544 isoform X1 n=1 Tax=Vespa crabro TaxID=7445 RepID=UPI001F0085BC|nr:uncharacterized protein LOC124424544 isoform X1 [Vespa crabro]XP_046819710.1 uncharacterized protein LOC124424544 isoform X1 [Vespa crabro]XP_046819711.1 uncharacterized protein LOC124424544 isoform X1 [Vespa crabro]